MNTAVGSARARDFHRLFEKLAESSPEFGGDGATLGLGLKPKERCTVVFDGAANDVP